jgi:UPF0716 protein FxsA
MVGLLLLVFLVVPVVELYVILQVGQALGALPTVGLLVAVSVLGAWLVRREGLGVWRRVQALLARGELPTTELLDGFLVLLAGALMLTPGFLTDAAGLVLLVPPGRAAVRAALVRHYRGRVTTRVVAGTAAGFGGPGVGFVHPARVVRTEVVDVGDVTPPEWRPDRGRPTGELGAD